MIDKIAIQLDKTYYVRSKISYYPISHSLQPIPDGMSAVIFKNEEDIDSYFHARGINDPENFELLPVVSFYDFMCEVADMGFIGIWFFDNFPILFGNYNSDIDIELPSFAYTYGNQFIGASGDIDPPAQFIQWKNYFKTDKIIKRFVKYANGIPFNPRDDLYTIIYNDQSKFERVLSGEKEYFIKYSRFSDGSPLQGPYVSDLGAYCLFTEMAYAQRFLQIISMSEKTIYKIEKIDRVHSFLDTVSFFPIFDVGINPGNERYLQGYFLRDERRKLIRTVLGVFELRDDLTMTEVSEFGEVSISDTIEVSNSMEPSLRGFQTTIKNPLKNVMGTTKTAIPQREAKRLINNLIEKNKYINYPDEGFTLIKSNDISIDSFLVYGFDKISGDSFSNNEETVTPYVFQDILDAILYLYHAHLLFDYELRFKGYSHCNSNMIYQGTHNEDTEKYLLSEQRNALRDLIKMVLTEGYNIDHAKLLRNFINRSSVSLNIEACGYLGDLAIYDESTVLFDESGKSDSEITERISLKARKYRDRLDGKIELDNKYLNKIRLFLGESYNSISIESLCILESAIKQFEGIKQRINHDYAGITMKLCKVFERELTILVFQKWKKTLLSKMKKADLKIYLEDAKKVNDITTIKLIGWLLKKNKLELGPMAFVINRLMSQCDNDVLTHLKDHISKQKNNEFIFSKEFLDACKKISTRYRNGGVHEKIVTFEICKEAFENILMKNNCYLKNLANI